MLTRRLGLTIAIFILVLALGIFFLMRSCLSKYDERSAMGGSSSSASQFLVFEKEGQGIVFSLVRFDKTVSYEQKGGMVNKNVFTTYYAQNNDLATAAKSATQKIKTHKQIKSYPVEILGAADNQAWIFAGELMAYDPFTLSKTADAAIIETKNPALKGKLLNERRYYQLDKETGQLTIIAADGVRYILNTNTLIAIPETENAGPVAESRVKELEKITARLRNEQTLLYNRLRENNRRYSQKELSINNYKDSSAAIEKINKVLKQQLDSLNRLVSQAREDQHTEDANRRQKEKVIYTGSGYSNMKVNGDTLDGRWYGLVTNEELTKMYNRFSFRSDNDETARNRLFIADMVTENNSRLISGEKTAAGSAVFLQGGFLISRETGTPFHLQHDFLIVYKDRIGKEGMIQLARISTGGQQLWTISTGLSGFNDWQLKGNYLVLTGKDNKELSSGDVNLLEIIDLAKGTVTAYDYFTDKVRTLTKQ